jgi:predicted porin
MRRGLEKKARAHQPLLVLAATAFGMFTTVGQAAADPYGQAAADPHKPAVGPTNSYDDLAPQLIPFAEAFRQFPVPNKDGKLSYMGVTLYGGVDMGVGYQSHGAQLTNYYGPGREYLISKNANHTQVGLMPNALSYSSIGLKGKEDILPGGWSVVFNLQTTFLPTSGFLSDFGKSNIENNGKTPIQQLTTYGDSSKAGQIFTNEAYGGLSHQTFGTMTFGRQNSLLLDAVNTYDPMSASSAFSVIGYSGTTAGTGDTEDARLDNALKYRVNVGPFRASALWQIETSTSQPGNAYEFGAGVDYAGFSFDGIYSHVNDAIASAPLPSTFKNAQFLYGLAGTISDDTSFMLTASYKFEQIPLRIFFGFEDIWFANPHNPLGPGSTTIGGYELLSTNNTAYTINKNVQVYWAGAKYGILPNLDLMVAYYQTHQDSYSGNGCTTNVAATCAGDLRAESLVLDYRFNQYLDAYAGAMYSRVDGGLANGYINNSTIDPTVGLRFTF